jgi:prepilin-type N-terminal cleavage/methylation domain-containing protein
MAQKYTILKVITQSFSRVDKTNKGFTLIELMVGLSIMLIVGGLAMNALIQASISFNKDKKSIDSNQSVSAILEIIGNDIKQSGENINDSSFPAIEFNIATASETNLKTGSSKVIIRRALISPLTLCETITAGQNLTTLTAIKVADNLGTTVTSSANCDVATSSAPLSVYRVPIAVTPATTPATYHPTTYYPTTPVTALPTITPAPLALKLPVGLRKLRDYRCQLDNPNPATAYDLPANAGTDFCDGADSEKTRIAISNESGQFLIFNQTGEAAGTSNTADTVAKATGDSTSTKTYNIVVNNNFARLDPADLSVDPAIASNTTNNAVQYPIKSPIYVIEERIYTLTSDNKLQLSINGKAPETLVKKIENFRVSARGYTNAADRIVNPTPPVAAADLCSDAPTSSSTPPVSVNNPQYICKFNYNAVTDPAMNWKMVAGVKVEIQTKYDGTGQNATATTADTDKLKAQAEFFPRNVLSK